MGPGSSVVADANGRRLRRLGGGTLAAALRDPFPLEGAALATRGIAIRRERFDGAWRRLPPETAATAYAYLGRTDGYWRSWDGRALWAALTLGHRIR